MCVVSNVYDLGKEVPSEYWTTDRLNSFRKVVQIARTVDEEENTPDCEDPTKAEWLEEVEERLAKLEAHVARIEYALED